MRPQDLWYICEVHQVFDRECFELDRSRGHFHLLPVWSILEI